MGEDWMLNSWIPNIFERSLSRGAPRMIIVLMEGSSKAECGVLSGDSRH